MEKIEERAINALRFLSIDQVEKAKSGHPGMPLGASHIVFLIFDKFLKFNPKNPKWIDRDRFVLSAGHASAMLYSALYLFGYPITLDDLKNFRQLGSITPGHPESFITPGVEATTGPLGQGFTNAVGMAIAEKFLAEKYNREGFNIIDHYTYVLCSDGDLMEGISYEAGAIAGHLGLGKLVVIWDNNRISIDGSTELAWSEDVLKRFEALGWHVQHIGDGYNLEKIEEAINKAKSVTDKPSFISVRTHIGYGSPKQDDASVHGAPLGEENVKKTRENLNWHYEPFEIPEDVLSYTRRHVEEGKKREEEWKRLFEEYKRKFSELAEELERAFNKDWGDEWKRHIPVFEEALPTRKASGMVLNAIAKYIPTMLGGSADLSESNNTYLKGLGDMLRDNPTGRNIHYGVREHAMGSIMNGMAYHGGILPYGGTFLVFSDYMRPAIRMACLSSLQVIYVFTHDSIGLGEDGPTHQPIEQLSSLRLIPNLWVLRPADPNEVGMAYKIAIERENGPTALILTRQKLPLIDRTKYTNFAEAEKGAYIIAVEEDPEVIIYASGSEVYPALQAREILKDKGIKARVVNVFSFELFDLQDKDYKDKILSPDIGKKVAIEAGRGLCWHKFVGDEGLIISVETFGKSAPGGQLMDYFGFTGEKIAEKILKKWYRS